MNPEGVLCGRCGQPVTGWAFINGIRYCHDDETPSCYEKASWGMAEDAATARSIREGVST